MKLLVLSFFLTISNFVLSQNVGVGTNSPSDALHIKGPDNEDALRVQVGNATKLRVFSKGGVTVGTNNQSGAPANGLYVSGNTGLEASSPQEKLVVDGNVDVRGELKADGVSGEQGQNLTPDGNGNMVWENLSDCRFTNGLQIEAVATFSWQVPAEVTLGDDSNIEGADGYIIIRW